MTFYVILAANAQYQLTKQPKDLTKSAVFPEAKKILTSSSEMYLPTHELHPIFSVVMCNLLPENRMLAEILYINIFCSVT